MTYQFYITPQEYDYAKSNGISKIVLDSRIRDLAWEKQRAINEPVNKRDRWKKWVEIAETNGISYKTFYARVNKYNYTLERAASEPLEQNQVSKMWAAQKRVVSKDIKKLAEENGVKYWTLIKRIKKGMDPITAATTPVMSREKSGKLGKAARIRNNGPFQIR